MQPGISLSSWGSDVMFFLVPQEKKHPPSHKSGSGSNLLSYAYQVSRFTNRITEIDLILCSGSEVGSNVN